MRSSGRSTRRRGKWYREPGAAANCGWTPLAVKAIGWVGLSLVGTVLGAETTAATDDASPQASPMASVSAPPSTTLYERVSIVGSEEVARTLPGSATSLDLEDLERFEHSDVQRLLQQVPGIVFQEEDGYGYRPNIGMRGTGVERSQKITLLEDGVLIAPAPYTAPAAYYFPTVERMEGVEVRKGSVSIIQGPYTTGGSLNLISRSIPSKLGGSVEGAVGEHDMRRGHGHFGGSGEHVGLLIDLLSHENDGFKDLDGPASDTGTRIRDGLTKLRAQTSADSSRYQQFELKLGRTEQFGRETYLGLSQVDFDADPLRRYAASALDSIDTDHRQVQGRYFLHLGRNLDLVTTVYRNEFERDWFKNERTLGVSNSTILADPASHLEAFAVLRGDIDSPDDAFTLRHNRRAYDSRGVDARFTWSGIERHDLQFGVRRHEDEEDRFQDEEFYRMNGLELTRSSVGAPGSQTNRLSDADVVSAFIEDVWRTARLTVRAGLRYENIEYRRFDFSTADPLRAEGPQRVRENGVDVLIPGIGATWQIDDGQNVFVSVHRGFSPPGAGRNEDTREERSVNYELGYRTYGPLWGFEAVAFYNDYDNLLGVETVSGGGGSPTELFNGGEVEVHGTEVSARWTPTIGNWRFPLRAAYTWTRAEFQTSFETGFADWSPRVERGDELPYLPEHQVQIGFGAQRKTVSLYGTVFWSAQARARAGQGAVPSSEVIDERVVVDLGARWRFTERVSSFVQVRNLLDEIYVAARRPYGVRPGLDQTVLAGVEFDF